MKYIFHIGAGKTGSSAIQHALALNESKLSDAGIYLPAENLEDKGNVTGYHVWWFESIKQMETVKASEELASKFVSVVSSAEAKGCNTILFSAENLSNPFSWSELLKDVLNEHEVQVLIYIRRQDDYLLSAWQQWGIKSGNTLESWMFKHIGSSGDWSVPIKEWQSIATEELLVRVYQRDRLRNQDVVDDFFDALDIEASGFARSNTGVNTSYNIAVEELALAAPGLFEGPHDNDFFNMVQKYCKTAHKKLPGESRLNASERRSIINRYQQSNQWIKDQYFKNVNVPLFKMPDTDEYHVATKEEIETRKWAVLSELVYGMHKHRN